MNLFKVFLLSLIVSACMSSKQNNNLKIAWDEPNDPLRFESLITEQRLDILPLSGELESVPWSGDYWRALRTGTAYRWHPEYEGERIRYSTLSPEELNSISEKELSYLSPAEKYALFAGDFEFNFVKWERSRTRPSKKEWEGICHGWASASINYAEPNPVALPIKRPNGEKVELAFGSSDIKALLSYFQAVHATSQSFGIGRKCREELKTSSGLNNAGAECQDTNAGSFHLLMTNLIGMKKQGFVIDVVADKEVWNQPVFKFEASIGSPQTPSSSAAFGTVEERTVNTVLYYTKEKEPSWQVHGEAGHAVQKVEYTYSVEIDKDGKIIGGRWISYDRPDYITMRIKPRDFIRRRRDGRVQSDYWAKIGEILSASKEVSSQK